jgi:hypothetical protein
VWNTCERGVVGWWMYVLPLSGWFQCWLVGGMEAKEGDGGAKYSAAWVAQNEADLAELPAS